ncbi:syntaxin-22 [Quercus suber]|uniref:Syntaxin-22 n=1 Tax=Quercus suber TaxID=58331 RepID=A0AAW0L8M8_QUESU
MSFQDFQKPSSSAGGRSQPQSPSQAVAAAIFQINTAVSAFRRLPSKKIEDAKLVRDFQTTLQEFQKAQQLASERESTYSPSAPPPSKTSDSDDYSAPSVDQENRPFLYDQKRQEVVLLDNEISFNEAMIDEREQGIKDIEEQIGQASEIFKDLAVLVHEQGVVIDDVHSNIESSSAATTQGRVQLAKASKSSKSKSSWCWWVLVIFVIALIIFLLVLII